MLLCGSCIEQRGSKIIGAYDKVASLIFENDAELRDFETSLASRNGERERQREYDGPWLCAAKCWMHMFLP